MRRRTHLKKLVGPFPYHPKEIPMRFAATRFSFIAAVFLLFTLHSLAQNLEIYQPPSSTQPGYNDLFGANGDPVNLLAEPHVNGITVFYPWGGNLAGRACWC
jgi:hypothetical protein